MVVVDAYAAGRVPPELATLEWFREVGRVLAPAGLLLANVADEPGFRYAARVAAGARAALGHVAFVGLHEVLKGKRFGNLVLVGSARAARPVDAAPRHGIRRTAHRGAVVGRDRSTAAGCPAVQRGRGGHGILAGAAAAGGLASPLSPRLVASGGRRPRCDRRDGADRRGPEDD